jgi:short-subunit dehydrogenase
MFEIENCRAVLTGASRGIGVVIAEALADAGAELVVAARSAQELDEVAERVSRRGRRVVAVPTDVADQAALERLVASARRELGGIDLLVNNAGIETFAYYEDLSVAEIDRYLAVNLRAPMQLSRMVLPEMLERNRGHLVHIASLAGLGPTPYGEPYGATKAGLVGFSRSLRASLQSRGKTVGSSVVCPGFVVDTGMYANAQRDYGAQAPAQMGKCTPQAVADAVISAIEEDQAEVIVNSMPVRPLLAVGAVSPRLLEWLTKKFNAEKVLREVADGRRATHGAQAPAGPGTPKP